MCNLCCHRLCWNVLIWFFDIIFYYTIFILSYDIIQIYYYSNIILFQYYITIYMYIIVFSYIYSTLSRNFASFIVPLPSPPCRRLSLKAHYLVNVLNSLILVSAAWNAGDMGHGNVHGIWMGYEWDMNGNQMGIQWEYIYIFIYIYKWNMHGIWMGTKWEFNGNKYIYMYI